MAEGGSGLVTILFTDLVGSTELLARAGDEEAQRIFRAHHDLLAETATAHGGEEVKWLGDGLMVAFPSAADAVRAAVAMQQASRRPVHGEQLAIRVGLNAGEVMRDAADWFGLPVVMARRLCDGAEGGEIRCTEVVTSLLVGHTEFAFADLGHLELKGVPKAVPAFAVNYGPAPATGLASRTPCVGRDAELERLGRRLVETRGGRGGLVLIGGEPGIGKTRLVEEVAEQAARDGVTVLWGHCYEGEWTPPYAPFIEAIEGDLAHADPEELRTSVGPEGPVLAQLVPKLRTILPDLPEAVPLPPDEERFRLLDAVAQYFAARAQQGPLLLCLDDLHWVDRGSLGMLRHLARVAARKPILIVGTYRDAEVTAGHPLADSLGAFPRETAFERFRIDGLGASGTAELLSAIAAHDVEEKVGAVWAQETDGNPFFIAELVRHLVEEGHLFRTPDGRWTTDRPLRELAIPDTVRDVIARRLSRLPDEARDLLQVASAFEGPFRFDVVATVAKLGEERALDGVDEALAAQLLVPAGPADTYLFHHALIRHTLYDHLGPSRRLRLHRQVAEALEQAYGGRPSPAQAGEIAAQYHRSASLAGAERGIEPALAAADHAQSSGGHDETVRFLRIALDLLPEGDNRRPRLLGRLGIVLSWALAYDEAVAVATEAGHAIAETEGKRAAAEYLSDAAYVCSLAGGTVAAWGLAKTGLAFAGARDVAWARLVSIDYERRAAEDPQDPGIPLDTADRRESARILRAARLDPMAPGPMEGVLDSREEAFQSENLSVLTYWAGEYARCAPLLRAEAEQSERAGRLVRAARAWAGAAICEVALGRVADATEALRRAQSLASRLATPLVPAIVAQEQVASVLDEGWEELLAIFGPLTTTTEPAFAWGLGAMSAVSARAAARAGRADEGIKYLERLSPWLEKAPAWTTNFPAMACYAAETLWFLHRLDGLPLTERAVREKVIGPDFRYPGGDGRLALARLCALTGRHDEALSWFGEARRVLTEQGALPLLAIADYDEALMYMRRDGAGDLERARLLLGAARRQFEGMGMTGWIRRAEGLLRDQS
jgi:class 3 adenylate cyclase/tetratricopeptide (TPR) repeat protein